MQDYVGKQIDRYRIIAQQGIGGMAVVYKAYDTRLERDVAFKLIRTDAIPAEQHERLMKRFEREAKSQARFIHRHVVSVYDYGEVNGSPYLVMAFIPGGTLRSRTGKPIHYAQAIRWLLPVADALDYAHKRGVVHRDIKPSNILFDEEDQPILTDFGIAKILETDEATLTGTGLGVGTPEYMAPEQWQGKVSDATDQYALGVVLYELLTGKKPYQADTPAAVAIMQATEPIRRPSNLVPGIPDPVEKLLFKALANRPQDRYENILAFQKAMSNLLGDHSKGAYKPTPGVESITELDNISESETLDILEPTPVEELKQSARREFVGKSIGTKNRKAGLPTWVLWSMSIVLILSGAALVISRLRGGRMSLPFVTTFLSNETGVTHDSVSVPTETELPLPTVTETSLPTSTPTTEPTPTIIPTMVNLIDGAPMVFVPQGEFLMGSDDPEVWTSERPEHRVFLDDFWIYQHEVTNREYRLCVDENTCNEPRDTTFYNNQRYDAHPVVYVNWQDASTYCEWAGGRLSTEAEWEKAARGTDGRKFPWGMLTPTCNLGNFTDCGGETTAIGSLPDGTSPYGALDMAGNVWEWVADWYDDNYYAQSPYKDPTGPLTGIFRVLRGGSWNNGSWVLRSSIRLKLDPDLSNNNYGFRCLHRD